MLTRKIWNNWWQITGAKVVGGKSSGGSRWKLKKTQTSRNVYELHAQIVTSGAAAGDGHGSVSVLNNLMNAYINSGLIWGAHKVFDQIPEKNLVSWTILISGFTKHRLFHEAVNSFVKMLAIGLLPNPFTVSAILPAFPNLGLPFLLSAKSLHGFCLRRPFPSLGFHNNLVLDTCFLHMYSRFGCITLARSLFHQIPHPNLVSWNVIISTYANSALHADDAIFLFNSMRTNYPFSHDHFTIMSLILASSRPTATPSSTHACTITMGYYKDTHIQAALIHMYTSTDFIPDAYAVFNEMTFKDLVAWTLMLKGFSSAHYSPQAMQHLTQLVAAHYMSLDSTALVTMISCCASASALSQGRLVHALALKTGFTDDVFLGSALIDMYASCCDLHSATNYFCGMEKKDTTCWNAMIRALGMNGNATDAVVLLQRMEHLGFNPNESTFVSILSACSHAGMVDQGLRIFYDMTNKWGVIPNSQHYACLVDILGRSGRLDEALLVIAQMPLQPHLGAYGALLSACTVYGNTKVGAEIYQQLLKLNLIDVGHLSSVSNMFSSMGDWGGKEKSRIAVRLREMKKDPGYSLIDKIK